MRSTRTNHNQIAVSAYAKETAINTEQTLDLSLLAQTSDMIVNETVREDNRDEMTGKEEADTIYDLGKTASLSLNFPKAQAQHFALLYAYALGSMTSAAAGSGYEKTIVPLTNDLDSARSLPSLTAAQRYGKTVYYERFASMFVDSVNAKFTKGQWVEISGQLKGTGKSTVSIVEEEITAKDNVTSLPLAANKVAGSTAAERLDAVHSVKIELTTGVWTEVVYTAVSAAEPAVITIVAPAAGNVDKTYKVLYAPDEAAWMSFPARVSQTPLRVSEVTVSIGGTWSGSAIGGGRTFGAEINSIEHNLSNNGNVEFSLGASGAYGASYFRDGRTQTLMLDREARDYVIQNFIDTNETFAVQILATGAIYDDPHMYQVQMVFPKVGVLKATITQNGKRLGEKGDLIVMEDDTYGSVIVKVKDLQQYYAA